MAAAEGRRWALDRDRKLESAGAGGGTWGTFQLGPVFEVAGSYLDQIVAHLLLEERHRLEQKPPRHLEAIQLGGRAGPMHRGSDTARLGYRHLERLHQRHRLRTLLPLRTRAIRRRRVTWTDSSQAEQGGAGMP